RPGQPRISKPVRHGHQRCRSSPPGGNEEAQESVPMADKSDRRGSRATEEGAAKCRHRSRLRCQTGRSEEGGNQQRAKQERHIQEARGKKEAESKKRG